MSATVLGMALAVASLVAMMLLEDSSRSPSSSCQPARTADETAGDAAARRGPALGRLSGRQSTARSARSALSSASTTASGPPAPEMLAPGSSSCRGWSVATWLSSSEGGM